MDRRPQSRDELVARIQSTAIEGTPEAKRAAFARLMGPSPGAERTDVGGVPCGVWGSGAGTLLWLHGGGLVMGSPETHAVAAAYVAREAGVRIVMPDYPKAPEHLWPAQREACLSVLDAIDGPVQAIGDSVGGQLALVLAFARPGRLDALTLISPNTDRTGRSTTRARDTDLMNDDAGDAAFARMAFGDADPADPEVSPLLGDLSVLPPTLIVAAGAEILLDDSLLLARAAALQGVAVDLRVWRNLFHLWPLWPDALPEARDTLAAICRYVTIHSGN